MDVEPDLEHIQTLLAMGFAEEHDVRKALKLAKNDLSEAVSYLTHETPGLDIEMVDSGTQIGPSTSSKNSSSTTITEESSINGGDQTEGPEDSLEFPTTHLYELEGRVLNVSNWNVPYAKNESLGRCMTACIRLAKEKLSESDDSCRRFLERSLPTSFDKLLASNEVMNKWGQETLDGILTMLEMLVELVAIRLSYKPIPHELLRTFATALNLHCNYHSRTKQRRWDKYYWEGQLGKDNIYARPSGRINSSYGYLVMLINKFAQNGGFECVRKMFEDGSLDSADMYSLLYPFGLCAEFLTPDIAGPALKPCVQMALEYVKQLSDNDLRSNNVSSVVDLVSALTEICYGLQYDLDQEGLGELRLDFVLRLLKCNHFGARMMALKEVTKLLDSVAETKKDKDKLCIPANKISEWLADNRVLSLALEGNLDQLQYVDRLKTLLDFLGPQLSCQEITKIWSLRKGRTAVTVDNIYRIVGQAACKFNDRELDHLLELIEKSWKAEEDRGKERIVYLLGRIGRETNMSLTQEKVADLLWKLLHGDNLSAGLIYHTLGEQHGVINESTKDDLRNKYIFESLYDIQKGLMITHMIYHLKMLIDSMKSRNSNSGGWTGSYGLTSATERKRRIIVELCEKHQLIESVGNCLTEIQKAALATVRDMPARSSTPVLGANIVRDSNHPSPIPPAAANNMLLMPAPGGENDCEKRGILEPDFGPSLLLPDGNMYGYYVETLLQFISFVLKEGNLSLAWIRTKHLWETMIENESGCIFDKQVCFKWFCDLRDNDLQEESRTKLLMEKLLRLDPIKLIAEAFFCFRKYFEIVNRSKGKLKEYSLHRDLEVEDLDLIGFDFVWEVALSCPNMDIASQGVRMLIDLSYSQLSAKHKREPEVLHRRFLNQCASRLESSLISVKGSMVGRALSDAAKVLTVVPVPALSSLSTVGHCNTKRSIERLLMIASRYIWTVEQDYKVARLVPPHGMSFYGKTFNITIISEVEENKGEWNILVHANETLRSVRERVAMRVGLKDEVQRVELDYNGSELDVGKDQKLLRQLEMVPDEYRTFVALVAKRRLIPISLFDSWNKDAKSASENEKVLPSVMMTTSGQVFDLLNELATLDEQNISGQVRQLLLLNPCDPSVAAVLDELRQPPPSTTTPKSNSLERKLKNMTGSGDKKEKSPKLKLKGHSPKPSWVDPMSLESPSLKLKKLLDGTQPFRLLYNLEVLSSRLLPTTYDDNSMRCAAQFCRDFMHSNGLVYLLDLLKRDALPQTLDLPMRQDITSRLLQLLCYLLCGQSELHRIVACEREAEQILSEKSGSPASGRRTPTPGPSTSTAALAASAGIAAAAAASSDGYISSSFGNLETPRCYQAREMNHDDFAGVLVALQRVAWTAAAGMLQWGGNCDLKSPRESGNNSSFMSSPKARTSESSTGSSEGSSAHELPNSVHAGLSSGHIIPSTSDEELAHIAFQLMTDSVLMRPTEIGTFFALPHFSDFILDLILLTPSEIIRKWVQFHLLRLANGCRIETSVGLEPPVRNRSGSGTLRKLFLHKTSPTSAQSREEAPSTLAKGQPHQLLLQILLKAHLPLWSTSSLVRGTSRRLLSQCSEYFNLRSALLAGLSDDALKCLQPGPSQMLDDEAHWLLNFTCSTDPRAAETDNRLLAGHMRLIGTLLKKLPEQKQKLGKMLIKPVVAEFLFPAARLVAHLPDMEQANAVRQVRAADMRARCQNIDGRIAAYELLEELCRECPENFVYIAALLSRLHHQNNPSMTKEWDYLPLVDRKMDSGYIGLKNAGATCYMNSVLQQLFMEPAVSDTILAVEFEDDIEKDNLLAELQRLFAHLRESELQYHTPTRFWDVFRLWGQHVNPREQQDAFEFYTCLIDQLDSELKKNKHEELFRRKYQGIFSDQKICHGCPHRYEREEAFYALNLPLRAHGLEESLNQFVKGEILEGENSYYCEKCKEKRTTLKRLCIKQLPSVLVIQLKRFGYDWEENRALKFNDHFQFPRSLDMFPYTVSALNQSENIEDLFDQSTQSQGGANLSTASYSGPLLTSSAGTTPVGSPLTPANVHPLWRKPSLLKEGSARYDLVGTVVHSGQANAGHYYAFIKERREETVLNGNFGKWFKFNDTTVEEVDMNDMFMENELFGGRYTVKTDKSSLFPEERERYWNGYLLFYERTNNGRSTPNPLTPKYVSAANKRSISVGITSPPVPLSKTPRRRDSFGELAALVEQGERRRMFRDPGSIPATLREEIREENLLFAKNRDIFNDEYFRFISNLTNQVVFYLQSSSEKEICENFGEEGVKFATEFLFHLCWHTKKSLRGDVNMWIERLRLLLSKSQKACQWLFTLLSTDERGKSYSRDFLFNCESPDVRQAFSQVLLEAFRNGDYLDSESPCPAADDLMVHLLSLIKTDAESQCGRSGAFFNFLLGYASLGTSACHHLLNRGAFRSLLDFMIEMPTQDAFKNRVLSLKRRWGQSQAKEFGAVYNTLSLLIMSCDLLPFSTIAPPKPVPVFIKQFEDVAESLGKLACPKDVEQVVFGPMMPAFVKELLWAITAIYNTQTYLLELVLRASYCNEKFSRELIAETLYACSTYSVNELKRIFTILEELLIKVEDELQQTRIDSVLDGVGGNVKSAEAEGLLAVVKSSHTTDSRRSYNCVKFLVAAADKCPMVKESLNQRMDGWQWAVDWLKTKMDDQDTTGTSYSTTTIGPSQSNEDSISRSFQRTVSAQYTLDHATAILSEFEGISPEQFDANQPESSNSQFVVEIECSEESTVLDSPKKTGKSQFYVGP